MSFGTGLARNGLHSLYLLYFWSFTGPLPPPENLHIYVLDNSEVIEWNPPYSANNTNSSIIHVDPHVTQYTVHIIDNYTGNSYEKVNVAGTSFRRNFSDDHSCPVYRVTAWNSGGEGDMSVPLPGYLPRSKLSFCNHIHLTIEDKSHKLTTSTFHI